MFLDSLTIAAVVAVIIVVGFIIRSCLKQGC